MFRFTILLASIFLMAVPARAGEIVTYKDGDTVLEGYLAKSEMTDAPIVMIVHQWKGLGEYEKARADMLAREGYNAFAIDMYGQGIRPKDPANAGKEAGKYKGDPKLALSRMDAALAYARSIKDADPKRIAVIGYCFGGSMALELA